MIYRAARLILPLVYHLVQQRRDCLVPTVIPYVPSADDNLGAEFRLTAKRVMAQPALHSPRHTNRNIRQLTAELGCVELTMHTCEIANVFRVRRMSAVLYDCDAPWRIELEAELFLEVRP